MTAAPAPAPTYDNLRGAAWMLLSVVAASAMLLSVRALSAEVDSRMVVVLRSALTLPPALAAILIRAPFRQGLRMSRPRAHLWRGILVGVSTLMGFHAVAQLPVATAAILFLTAPIFATVLAIPFQGETVGIRRWAAVAAGFVGAIIILRPGAAPLDWAMLSAIGSSLLFAVALIQSRPLVAQDGAVSVFLSSSAVTLLVAVPAALPVWELPQTGRGWTLAMAVVVWGAVRGLADIKAYHHAEASVLAPITYLRLVLLGAAGYLLYGEVPDGPTLAGAAVIVGSTLYIARREAQLRKARRAAERAAADARP